LSVQTPREIHLDFHNAPDLTGIGSAFRPEEFADTARRANVTSMNVFAKCHHGFSYYPTGIGTMHPGLAFDLLGQQIDALHAVGIKAPVYISVLWDDLAGEVHPEWVITTEAGRTLMRRPLSADSPNTGGIGWTTLDISGGYGNHLRAIVQELLSRYDVDGFWFDIVWAQPNFSAWGQRRMREAGVDLADSRMVGAYSAARLQEFLASMSALIRQANPSATIFYNGQVTPQLAEVADFMTQVEVESLPTSGNQWGYPHFPMVARFARTLSTPLIGMTGRFHKSWADFGGLKTTDQLLYECGTILSAGAGVSVGDQLDPSGRLDPAVYRTIGAAFDHIADREPWLVGSTPMAEVGVLGATVPHMRVERPTLTHDHEVEGIAQMLLELGVQFDIIDPDRPDYGGYRALMVPESLAATPEVVDRIQAARSAGVKLILTGTALLDEATQEFRLPGLPMRYVGPAPTVPSFLRLGPGDTPGEMADDYDYVFYDQAHIVEPRDGSRHAGELKSARYNRTWEHYTSHAHAPVGAALDAPVWVSDADVLYFAAPVFTAYLASDYWVYRELFAAALDELLPDRLVRVIGPGWVEVTRHSQKAGEGRDRPRDILHLTTYQSRRVNHGAVPHVDQSARVSGVELIVSAPASPFTRAWIAPTGEEIPHAERDGAIRLSLPPLGRHTLVVLE
jgi:hypothetical protein